MEQRKSSWAGICWECAGNMLGRGGKVPKLIVDRMWLMLAIMLADVRGQGFQWKADVRSLVRNFAEEQGGAMVLCPQDQFRRIWETDFG